MNIKRIISTTFFLILLIFSITYNTIAYDNFPSWTKNLENYASEKYRISLTEDQNIVYAINKSLVVGLNPADGSRKVEILPARYVDMIDGIKVHGSGKYVVSIVNGTYISVYNTTSYKNLIFKANATVENIILPKSIGKEYTIVYTTSDGNITRADLIIPSSLVVRWSTKVGTRIYVIDCDDPFYRILAGSEDGTLTLIDPVNGKVMKSIRLDEPITSLDVSSFGFFAAITTKNRFYLIRTDTLYIIETLTLSNTQFTSSIISYDGARIALGLSNGTILHYNTLTGEWYRTIVSRNIVKIVGDKNVDYIAWTSEGKVGIIKFTGEDLWSYTISTTSLDIAISFNEEEPEYLIACTKTKIFSFTRKPFAKITLNANPKVIGLGNNITLEGILTPNIANQTIKLYIQENETIWTEIGRTKTDTKGTFKFTYKPTVAGILTFKALWEGNVDFKQTAVTTTVDVRKPIMIIIKAIDLNGKPLQALGITLNETKYYTNSSGYVKIYTYAGTLNLITENTSNITSASRYRFKVWEDLGFTRNQIIVKVDSNRTFTIKYTIEYMLKVDAPKYFLYDLSPSSLDHWYENGTKVEITMLPIESYNTTDTRIVFAGWEGRGLGSYSGKDYRAKLIVLGPIEEKILWKTQYKLDIIMIPNSLDSKVVKLQPFAEDYWFDEGTEIDVEAPAHIYSGENIRYTFSHNKYDDTVTYLKNFSFKLDKPKTLNITYYLQYYLKVTSDYGIVEGTGWYNASQKATFRILNSTIYISEGIRKVFVEWKGTITSTSTLGQIVMNSPANLHAVFVTQYFLNVTSEHAQVLSKTFQGNPSKWYNEGVEVSFYISDLTVDKDFFTYYEFEKWIGDVESSEPIITLKMNRPYNVKAQWHLAWKTGNILLTIIPILTVALTISWILYYKKYKKKSLEST
ncbi:MAG: hypothetical protein QXD95_02105 [Nitrososphaeria archaeon]